MTAQKKIAIIPARGGSKRIPQKNIREFFNKPVIAYSIRAALQSELFDRVIVSTDNDEIADVALSYGAEVPFIRPAELSGDQTGIIDVMSHAVNWVCQQEEELTAVCCIFATAPFIQKEDLKKGLDILEGGRWQYVFSATHFGSPIFRSFKMQPDNSLDMLYPEHFYTRSQDLPETMHDAGQFYWGRPQAWLDGLKIFDRCSTVVELPRWRVQDIDTMDDWERAEMIFQLMQTQRKCQKNIITPLIKKTYL